MALIICRADGSTLRPRPMDNEPWQRRAKSAGLTQKMLAEMTGRPVNTISRQIRGEHGAVPLHLIAVITAWELMTDEQRDGWQKILAREAPQPKPKTKPRAIPPSPSKD